MMSLKGFPFYKQLDAMDCGPTALQMVSKYYGKYYPLPFLREISYIDREGVSLKGISEAADRIGLRTLAVKIPFSNKSDEPSLMQAPLPAIVHWNGNHFVVVYKLSKKYVWVADPASGKYKLTVEQFKKSWVATGNEGVALLLEPSITFAQAEDEEQTISGFGFLKHYFKPHRRLIGQLVLGLVLASIFQLIFPFLTQSLVDIGIDTQNLHFIYLILIAQLMLFFSQTIVQFIQSWILLHVSVRVNVSLISDFLAKLMRLPIGFFDSKNIGDLMQRINDHRRIESFLTQSTLSTLFSLVNIVVFGFVLSMYSVKIFLIFLVSAILYVGWIFIFLKRRKEVDYESFQRLSDNQDSLVEIIQGMAEIKIQGSQQKRRWQWAHIQAKLFRAQIKSLAISQYQDAGALFINRLKDILITFVAATSVLNGSMTLGMMLAVQFIIGQLNGPLQQLVAFVRSAQDAKISLERLGEVHNRSDEEASQTLKSSDIPQGDIEFDHLSFQYSPISELVLKDINITIPRGKVTAIVGMSGSGKTTLLKLLLGFYQPTQGNIQIGDVPLNSIYMQSWRAKCGVVLQESYVFSDSIANNIAESDDTVNRTKLVKAAKTANIMPFVETLPLGFSTKIGAKGNGVSQGQKQRLLIARAVYKDPEFIFLDEATNSLDANNEKIIMNNLNEFFKDRTVIVVAHRLSTVKNADQIIVLGDGEVVETGNHESLVAAKGDYYTLVKNQLELGS